MTSSTANMISKINRGVDAIAAAGTSVASTLLASGAGTTLAVGGLVTLSMLYPTIGGGLELAESLENLKESWPAWYYDIYPNRTLYTVAASDTRPGWRCVFNSKEKMWLDISKGIAGLSKLFGALLIDIMILSKAAIVTLPIFPIATAVLTISACINSLRAGYELLSYRLTRSQASEAKEAQKEALRTMVLNLFQAAGWTLLALGFFPGGAAALGIAAIIAASSLGKTPPTPTRITYEPHEVRPLLQPGR